MSQNTDNPRVPISGSPSGPNWQLLGVAALAAAQWVVFLAFMVLAVTHLDGLLQPEALLAKSGGPIVSDAAVLAPVPEPDLAAEGARLFVANGCEACHSIDGSAGIGPTLRGAYGRTARMIDGASILTDDAYLRESIVYPAVKKVEGFEAAAMPNYGSLLSEQDVDALIEYIRSIP